MTKKIAALMTIAALALAFPVSLIAQGFSFSIPFGSVKLVSAFIQDASVSADTQGSETAASTPAYWIKYVGGEESGTLDLNANAIEFFSGPLGSEVINGTTGSDVNVGDLCGTANDSLDVTDAQCDTPEELCQVVNDAGATTVVPWVCVLGAVTQAATLATAAEYTDMADVQAKLPGGVPVFIDNDDVDELGILMRPDVGYEVRPNDNNQGQGDIEFFLKSARRTSADVNSYAQDQIDNPFEGQRAVLTYILANLNSTTAWTLEVRARKYRPGGSVDERVVFSTVDTTDATDEILDFSRAPLVSGPGETFLITASDDALVTGNIQYSGYFIPANIR